MRMFTPAHADLHRARLLRWGKTPKPDDRAAAKEAIHEYMQAKVEQGQASTRAEVLTALQEAGLEINRAGKDYIRVQDPDGGEKCAPERRRGVQNIGTSVSSLAERVRAKAGQGAVQR